MDKYTDKMKISELINVGAINKIQEGRAARKIGVGDPFIGMAMEAYEEALIANTAVIESICKYLDIFNKLVDAKTLELSDAPVDYDEVTK